MKKKIWVVVCLVLTAILTVGCVSKGTAKEVIKDEDVKTRTIEGEDMTEIELLKFYGNLLLFPDNIFESEENYSADGKNFLNEMKKTISINFNNDYMSIKEGNFLDSPRPIESLYEPNQYTISSDSKTNVITINYIQVAVDNEAEYCNGQYFPSIEKYYGNVEWKFFIGELKEDKAPDLFAQRTVSITFNDKFNKETYSDTTKYIGVFTTEEFLENIIKVSSSKELSPTEHTKNIESGLKKLKKSGRMERYKDFVWSEE